MGDTSKMDAAAAAKKRGEEVQKGAQMLKKKYEDLQANIRETECHTTSLMNLLGMSDSYAQIAINDIQSAQKIGLRVNALLNRLSIMKPEFFESWILRIEGLENANKNLFDTCQKLVQAFT